jgi:hypothetical protein
MSRWPRVGLAVALALLVHALPAAGQDAAHYRAVFDSLAQRLRTLRRVEQLHDSLAAAGMRLDSVRAGPVTLLFNAHGVEREQVAAAARMVRTTLEQALGRDSGLASSRYYVGAARGREPVQLLAGVQVVAYDSAASAGAVAQTLVQRVAERLATLLGPALRGWVGPAVPLDTLDEPSLSGAYMGLVSARTHLAGACLEGDLDACAVVLAIRPVADPAMRLFTAQERRWLVAQSAAGDPAQRRRCLTAEDDAACTAVLRGSAYDGQEPLLRQAQATLPAAHRTLLLLALRQGGGGAYGRLINAGASPVAVALEATAGAPLDTLIAGWRAAVVGSRPEQVALAPKRIVTGLVWLLAFVVLVSRSSRWRRA